MSGSPPPEILAQVPPAVRLYMDTALEHLAECAREYGLEIHPYEYMGVGDAVWIHNLLGDFADWKVTFQLMTDADAAPWFQGLLRVYVLFKGEKKDTWVKLEHLPVTGLTELLSGMQRLAEDLRLTCALRMPRPDDPDPEA